MAVMNELRALDGGTCAMFPTFPACRLLNNSITEMAGFAVMNLSPTHMEGMNEFVKGPRWTGCSPW